MELLYNKKKMGRPKEEQVEFFKLPDGDWEVSTTVYHRVLQRPDNRGARVRAKIQRKESPNPKELVPRRKLRISDIQSEAEEMRERALADLKKYEQIVETIQQVQAMLEDGAKMGEVASSLVD